MKAFRLQACVTCFTPPSARVKKLALIVFFFLRGFPVLESFYFFIFKPQPECMLYMYIVCNTIVLDV